MEDGASVTSEAPSLATVNSDLTVGTTTSSTTVRSDVGKCQV